LIQIIITVFSLKTFKIMVLLLWLFSFFAIFSDVIIFRARGDGIRAITNKNYLPVLIGLRQEATKMIRPNQQQRPTGIAWFSLMLVAVESFQRSYPGPTLSLASSSPGFRPCFEPISQLTSPRIRPPSDVPWTSSSSSSRLLWGTKSDDDDNIQASDSNREEQGNDSSEQRCDPSFLQDVFDRKRSQILEIGSASEKNLDEEDIAQLLELGGDPSFLQSAPPPKRMDNSREPWWRQTSWKH
jgi:hypothetical protein